MIVHLLVIVFSFGSLKQMDCIAMPKAEADQRIAKWNKRAELWKLKRREDTHIWGSSSWEKMKVFKTRKECRKGLRASLKWEDVERYENQRIFDSR
jgi:hypothetical protein